MSPYSEEVRQTYRKSLCWLRRDLRLEDHTALAHACGRSGEVVVVFVFDAQILNRLEDKDDKRLTFIHRCLEEIDEKLKKLNSLLIVRHGDPTEEIPKLVEQLQADAVFTNQDYEPYAIQRDGKVIESLKKAGKAIHFFKDQVIFARKEILSGSGEPYKVFTPYKNAWLKKFDLRKDTRERKADLGRVAQAKSLHAHSRPWSLKNIGFEPGWLWLVPGESGAKKKVRAFEQCLANYDKTRDFPAVSGTSGLSVHLRFGTISIRKLVSLAASDRSAGAKVWLSELIWREFYQMILDQFPRVATLPFRAEYDHLEWPGKDAHYEAWAEGRTGYPLVDAAMRQLNETGWMHNRLRMVVASFFVKDLLLDYRKGEAYFARKLLDFDLSANNGGWQWSASTGCDSQPYFRVFNPILQSERFDANGAFIRQYCKELKDYSDKNIHFPTRASLVEQRETGCVVGKQYPAPIVDHAAQKEKAIQLFKAAKA